MSGIQTIDWNHHQLLSLLTPVEKAHLENNSRYKRVQKGQAIDYQEEHQGIYFILSGRLKICEMDENGDEIIKEVLKDGDVFGEMNPFHGDHYEYAETISRQAEILHCSLPVLEEIMEKNSKFSMQFSKTIWSRYKQFEKRYRNLALLKDARSRLMNFFKELALNEGSRNGNQFTFTNYLTHREIASLICSTRVTVTTLLNDMKASGEIKYNRRLVEIPDIRRL